ncbi:MAG: 1-acyl-sn-glycerol-3-phosphate acyltransferase [Alphaproteobacteria bacterium]|nr:1-acyl-sn-glycerol-3-phosphate acyltransferase [Alphaproteobacteria bacterium]
MAFLRSTLFALLFYLGSVPIVGIGALLTLVWRPAARLTGRIWSGWFRLLATHVVGIRIVVRGEIPNRPVIVAAKHESAFETMLVLSLFDHPAVVLKAELMRIPAWGAIARRHGAIPVDREASTAAMRTMLRAAEAGIAEGRPVFIFPEGSRIPVGEQPPLKPGVAGLYKMLKRPVVPLALDTGRLWPKHGWTKYPGTVTLAFGEEIPAGLPRAEVEARIHAAINRDPTA